MLAVGSGTFDFTLVSDQGAFSYPSENVRLLPPTVPPALDDEVAPALDVFGIPPPDPISSVTGSLRTSSICSKLMPAFIDDDLTKSFISLAASVLTEHIRRIRCRKRNFSIVANTPALSGYSWLFLQWLPA